MNLRQYVDGLDACVPSDRGECRYINFDNAASTPPLKSVTKLVQDFTPYYSAVHRSTGYKSRLSTDMYEQARATIGQFVGADPAEHVVIFGKNTTEAINKLSYRLNLRRRDVVIISHLEHHSNDLPWRAHATVARIAMTRDGRIDRRDFERLLQKYHGRVRLVAITGASNVTGYVPDIHWFARKAHAAGAEIFVDCAQRAAHRPIDMLPIDNPAHIDYVALSAHKMYAPFGSGALVGRRATFMRGAPEYCGGGTIKAVTPTHIDWALPPDSDEAGSPNVIGALAFAKAAAVLQRIGFDRIMRHELDITHYTLSRLSRIPGLKLYGPTKADRIGVVTFALGTMPPQQVAAILAYEWGIGVRAGCFCAQPYVMSLMGLDRSRQRRARTAIIRGRMDLVPGLVRISMGMYNTRAEVDILAEALATIATGMHGQYQVDPATGCYAPVGHADAYPKF